MARDRVAVENTGAAPDRQALEGVLTPAQYGDLAEVPPELIPNEAVMDEFSGFAGLRGPAELRTVTRAHVIAWRKDLEDRGLLPSSIRRKLSALSSLFDYLCERYAVSGNPVAGVKRPMANDNEGSRG